MKLSSREQLLKEAKQILQKLRQLREMNEAPLSGGTPPFKIKNAVVRAYMKQISQGGPKIKEVNFAKDPKKFAKGFNGANTRWKDTTLLNKKQALDILTQALPNGYNEFKPQIIDKLPADSKIQIAREGSVCLYVTTSTKPNRISLKADELDEVQPSVYRIWWD